MKTFYGSWRKRKAKHREAICRKMAVIRAAKERHRIERAKDDTQRVEWRGVLTWTITLHDRRSGKIRTLDVRRGNRRDQYDVTLDGQPWKQGTNATRLGAAFRHLLAPHISHI